MSLHDQADDCPLGTHFCIFPLLHLSNQSAQPCTCLRHLRQNGAAGHLAPLGGSRGQAPWCLWPGSLLLAQDVSESAVAQSALSAPPIFFS